MRKRTGLFNDRGQRREFEVEDVKRGDGMEGPPIEYTWRPPEHSADRTPVKLELVGVAEKQAYYRRVDE
jgi:hypothetical protein